MKKRESANNGEKSNWPTAENMAVENPACVVALMPNIAATMEAARIPSKGAPENLNRF